MGNCMHYSLHGSSCIIFGFKHTSQHLSTQEILVLYVLYWKMASQFSLFTSLAFLSKGLSISSSTCWVMLLVVMFSHLVTSSTSPPSYTNKYLIYSILVQLYWMYATCIECSLLYTEVDWEDRASEIVRRQFLYSSRTLDRDGDRYLLSWDSSLSLPRRW